MCTTEQAENFEVCNRKTQNNKVNNWTTWKTSSVPLTMRDNSFVRRNDLKNNWKNWTIQVYNWRNRDLNIQVYHLPLVLIDLYTENLKTFRRTPYCANKLNFKNEKTQKIHMLKWENVANWTVPLTILSSDICVN